METASIDLSFELQQLLSAEQAWHYRVIPKFKDERVIELFIDERQESEHLREELEVVLGKKILLTKASSVWIEKNLTQHYRQQSQSRSTHSVFAGNNLQALISEARHLGSSDIHIEIYENKARIRFRIDGQLIERHRVESQDYPALVNKIKIMANMDIAEKRLPQDGRIFFVQDNHRFDIRVSSVPSLHGEKIVLRLLGNDATNIDIKTLGFSPKQLKDYLDGTRKPHGIVLISGPTGSGKTTSLYATLKVLNKSTNNILTVEDPVEYTLEGINQVQVKDNIGLTFARALRSFLRQDPDIIMLGEIRDPETAEMAVRAAMTGHLVLSTIHTNSAWDTIGRLQDMGVPYYLIASTLNTSVAQRLLRLLCPHCKKEEVLREEDLPSGFKLPNPVKNHYSPVGCPECYYTGYKGRKAIYEVIPVDAEVSNLIKQKEHSVDEFLKQKGISFLYESALQLFAEGKTSLDEIYPILLNAT